MLLSNACYALGSLFWAIAAANYNNNYEVIIEVDKDSGAPKNNMQQKEVFQQLKSKIESRIRESNIKLREVSEEDENINYKGPGNNETKRIEMVTDGITEELNNKIEDSSNGGNFLQSLYKLGKSPLMSLNTNKSFITEQDKPIVDKLGRKVEILEYTDDMLRIGTDRNMFLTIINNLENMKLMGNKNPDNLMEGIVIYKNPENGNFVDFWHKLVFEEKDGIYKDTTGFYKGVLKNSWDSLVKGSRLGKHGFFIDTNIQPDVEEFIVYRSKKLIVDIAYFRKMKVGELMAKNKPLGLVESVVFYNLYPLRPNDIISVCVCENNNCKKPCTEIQRMERKNFL